MIRIGAMALLAGLLHSGLAAAKTHTVFVLRHAEKSTEPGPDPVLSEAGMARAARLPVLFENSLPQAVYSTQYRRTRATAKVLADAAGIEVTIIAIDKDNAAVYPDLLRERVCALPDQSVAVIIGHSNTVPELVGNWSGQPVGAIPDDRFDRIYVLRLQDCQTDAYDEMRY
jgi:phosphohistidine phosphatase SixA